MHCTGNLARQAGWRAFYKKMRVIRFHVLVLALLFKKCYHQIIIIY